ncbi:hypothetical protein [Candidatus Chlorohelix sp.]|uniref:hypothetical protein n=1 Tax=Candidatus Chlorohelix sp. TaxID=3139201 RepID=UPI0030569439
MSMEAPHKTGKFGAMVNEPPVAKWLFANTSSAPIWLVVRVWLGLQWFSSGWGKAMFWDISNSQYIANGGKGLKSFWERIVAVPPGAQGAVITYDWYYEFIKGMLNGGHYEWFSWFVAFGEMAVGLGLIFGCLTAVAAFFGTILNFSFELAGSTSTNPVLFGTAVFVILAWRTAGWWGLDRYVLPALGTPWEPGFLFRRSSKTPGSSLPPVTAAK